MCRRRDGAPTAVGSVEEAKVRAVVNAWHVVAVGAAQAAFHGGLGAAGIGLQQRVVVVRGGGQRLDDVDAVQPAGRRGVGQPVDALNARGAGREAQGHRPDDRARAVVDAADDLVDPEVGHAQRDGLIDPGLIGVLQQHDAGLHPRRDVVDHHEAQALAVGVARQRGRVVELLRGYFATPLLFSKLRSVPRPNIPPRTYSSTSVSMVGGAGHPRAVAIHAATG